MANSVISGYDRRSALEPTDMLPVVGAGDANPSHVAALALYESMIGRLNTPQWNDINFPGVSLGAGASAPDLITGFGAGAVLLRGFDGNVTMEQLYSSDEILHGYAEGTDITFHVHWMPTTANAGSVKWQLEYTWANVGDVMAAPTTISVTKASTGVAWTHQLASFATISGTGKEIGSQFAFRFFRDPTDDNYPDDAALLSIGIHYQINSFGSTAISTK